MDNYLQRQLSTLSVPYTKMLSRYRDIVLFHYEPSTTILLHHNRDYPAEPRNLRITFNQFRTLLKSKSKIHGYIGQARRFPDVYLRHEIDDNLRITINSNIPGITLRKRCSFIFLKFPEWYNLVNGEEEFMDNIPGLKVDESTAEQSELTTVQTLPSNPNAVTLPNPAQPTSAATSQDPFPRAAQNSPEIIQPLR